jgi:hypothetical protein
MLLVQKTVTYKAVISLISRETRSLFPALILFPDLLAFRYATNFLLIMLISEFVGKNRNLSKTPQEALESATTKGPLMSLVCSGYVTLRSKVTRIGTVISAH